MTNFQPYRVCFNEKGKPRKRVDKTSAHRDHIHIGMTKAGANGQPVKVPTATGTATASATVRADRKA